MKTKEDHNGKKMTLTDKIYQDLKDDITTKVFQPGEKLNIKELARNRKATRK